jgi:hypothetical protein
VSPAEPLRQLVPQIEHANEVGLDARGIGEHLAVTFSIPRRR